MFEPLGVWSVARYMNIIKTRNKERIENWDLDLRQESEDISEKYSEKRYKVQETVAVINITQSFKSSITPFSHQKNGAVQTMLQIKSIELYFWKNLVDLILDK